jgi:galactose mutarotase-like enzyme
MKMKTANFIKDGIDFYSIESENIKICACPEKGGELSSVEYKNLFPGKELLFRGNDYSNTACPFKGRAPLMWPAVTRNYRLETLHNGQVPDKCSYRYQDKIYDIGKSAFAKDLPWTFDKFGDDGSINLYLNSSTLTKKSYPFDFLLTASFRIEHDLIIMEYTVNNSSNDEMFFSIGNHIGINIPLTENSVIDSMILCSSGSHKRNFDEYGNFADKYLELPFQTGIEFDHPENIFNMVSCGYAYDDNFFRIADNRASFEIKHRVIQAACNGITLPDETELYYTTYGDKELGFICPEPWIGGINSLNTRNGLIKLRVAGTFKWEITIQWRKEKLKWKKSN